MRLTLLALLFSLPQLAGASSTSLGDLVDIATVTVNNGYVPVQIGEGGEGLTDILTRLTEILERQADMTQTTQISDGFRNQGIAFNGFGIQKTAGETQIFEEGFATDSLDTLEKWNETIVGGATIVVSSGAGTVSSFADGDSVIVEAKNTHSYLHGFSNLWRARLRTGDLGDFAGNTREWGVYDDDNGYFFRLDNTGLAACIRRAGVDTVISSTSWVNNPPPFSDTAHAYAIQYLNGNRVTFWFDGKPVYTAGSQTGTLVARSQLPTRFTNEQSGATSGERIIEFYGMAVIREGTPNTYDSAGRLRVSGGIVEAPEGTDPIVSPTSADQKITINSNQTVDEFYTITNGKTLTIQALFASVESAGTGKSVVFELFDDPTGTGAPLASLGILMGNNFNEVLILDTSLLGDGTRRVLLRSDQVGAANILISRKWVGFEQ